MKKHLLNILSAVVVATGMAGTSAVAAAAARIDSSIAVGEPQACIVPGGVELSAPADAADAVRFMVYSITGQVIKTVDVKAGVPVTVELPAGVYIVKCDKWSHRIIVR